MIETILHLDESLFFFINQDGQFALLDTLLPLVRNKLVWIPFYIFVFSFLLINLGKKGLIIVLFAIGTVAFSDMLSSKVIKPLVQRERPCNDGALRNNVRLLVSCGGGYSFTSSHAINHFGLAIFLMVMLGEMLRKKKWWLFLWAALIAYAQVYVGVHYPFDVLAGACLGILIGYSFGKLCSRRIHFVEERW